MYRVGSLVIRIEIVCMFGTIATALYVNAAATCISPSSSSCHSLCYNREPQALNSELLTSGQKIEAACTTLTHATPSTWDFPKIKGTLSWGPYTKDPTI